MTKECYYKKSKGITSVKIICITLQEYFFVPFPYPIVQKDWCVCVSEHRHVGHHHLMGH